MQKSRFKTITHYTLFIILTLSGVLFFAKDSLAACSWSGNTGAVASPYSATEVQDCITGANGASAKTGDVIVLIPNSTASWSSAVTANMRSGFAGVTSLTLRGQNDCTLDVNGRPTACGTNIANFAINYTGKEGKGFRVAHLKITGTSANSIDGDGKSWRFDHLLFESVTSGNGRTFWINKGTAGWITAGVIDSSYFHNHNTILVHYQPSADGGNADWMGPLDLGTADAFYIENNKIYDDAMNVSNGITDSNGSGKFVIRYNDIHNTYIFAHDAIVINYRGVRKWEIYNNHFSYDANGNCWVAQLRGGTGVFFNNTIDDPNGVLCGTGIQLTIYRTYEAGGPPWGPLCSNSSGKAILDTASNYPQTCTSGTGCINIDGSSSNPNGYPCRDQAGFEGNNPQTSRPFLFWNNSFKGSTTNNIPDIAGTSATYIVKNRDYCVGVTAMPASCNGVTTTYAPYTYPHPLSLPGSTPPDTTPPSPPTNVRVN